MTKQTGSGEHHITVPDHKTVAKGTLNDIMAAVSVRNGIARGELYTRLKG